MASPHSPLAIVVPLLLLLPLLYVRMRRLSRPRPLKLRRLWMGPAAFLGLAAVTLLAPPPGRHSVPAFSPMEWVVLALAALLGVGAGWLWGRTMAIEVHPEDGTLMVRGGQAAMLVLVVLIVMRMGLRYGAALEAQAWHLNAVLIADASILFSAFLFAVRGLEMFIRAGRVMAEAGANRQN